jgi:dTMP kinase
MRNENSVLFALKDLRAMEAERVADERQRAEEERRRAGEERRRAEEERRRAEEEQRRAEEAERTRQMLAVSERDKQRLEDALGEMRRTVARLAEERLSAPPSVALPVAEPAPQARSPRWPLAIALLAATAAMVALARPARVVYVAAPAPLPSAPPVVRAPAPLPPVPAAAPIPMPIATPPAVSHAKRRVAPKPHLQPATPALPPLGLPADCDKDPLCGTNLKP